MKRLIFVTVIALFLSSSFLGAQKNEDSQEVDHIVKMPNLKDFDPETLTIKAGETIKWVNKSMFKHTVTCDSSKAKKPEHVGLPENAEEFNSGKIKPGASFTYTFNKPGIYKYFCIPHELMGMLGKIIVEEKDGN